MSDKEIDKHIGFALKSMGWEETEHGFLVLSMGNIRYSAWRDGARLTIFIKAAHWEESEQIFKGKFYGGKQEIEEQLRFVLTSCIGEGNSLRAINGNLVASLFLYGEVLLEGQENNLSIEDSVIMINNLKKNKPVTAK